MGPQPKAVGFILSAWGVEPSGFGDYDLHCNDHQRQHCVGDRNLHSFGFGLIILQVIDVFWGPFTIRTHIFNLDLESEEV